MMSRSVCNSGRPRAMREPDHAVCVMALGWGQLRQVHIDVALIFATMMLRVDELNVTSSPQNQIAEIMQDPHPDAMTVTTPIALRARASPMVAAALYHLGFRQVSTHVIPSVRSATYSPGPGIVTLLGENSPRKIRGIAQKLTTNPQHCCDTLDTLSIFRILR